MSLAQRVRDGRYAKGWGPDELASRAEISRTALYQIESGKTEQPRAGTLRRIAQALSVPTETLLGQAPTEGVKSLPRPVYAELLGANVRDVATGEAIDEPGAIRLAPASHPSLGQVSGRTLSLRERDLERKFVDLLRSPLGESMTRIVEEMHRLIPYYLEAIH